MVNDHCYYNTFRCLARSCDSFQRYYTNTVSSTSNYYSLTTTPAFNEYFSTQQPSWVHGLWSLYWWVHGINTNTLIHSKYFSSSIYDYHSRSFIIWTRGRDQRISHLWTENGNHYGLPGILVISGYTEQVWGKVRWCVGAIMDQSWQVRQSRDG